MVLMDCDTPQFTLDGGITPCGLCMTCCRIKSNAERQRKFYWLKRKRGLKYAKA